MYKGCRINTKKYLCVVKYLTIGARAPIVMKMKNATVVSINERAVENLKYIRETMERAGAFTAVPGWGGVLMGISAVVTAIISGPPDNTTRWVAVWLIDAVVAVAIALVSTVWKARTSGVPLSGVPALRFALAYAPPL